MKSLWMSILLLAVVGCSSTKTERELEEVEHEEIEKDYVVKDAASKVRPGWVEDAEVWAKEYGKNTERYRFFSYETTPKVSRNIACNLAKANAKSDIAGEITTFINQQISTSVEGTGGIDENNPQIRGLREYVASTLTAKTKSLIHGASIAKTYWEKRSYEKDLGAKKDFKAYTCAVLVRVPAERLNTAIDEAALQAMRQVKGEPAREAVKTALKNAADSFAKQKQGML